MNILLISFHVLLLALLAILGYRKSVSLSPIASFYFPALLYRVGMGIGLGWVYHAYYQGGDTLNFFHDATVLAELAMDKPVQYFQALFFEGELPADLLFTEQPRALFFAKIVSVFSFITNGSYWLSSVYLSVISFFAVWYLANILFSYFGHLEAVVVAFLFYPSVVFWSSGIMKESLAVSMICLMAGTSLIWVKRQGSSWRKWALLSLLAVETFLLWKVKYYYAAILVPFLVVILVLYPLALKWKWQVTLAGFLVVVCIMLASSLHPNLQYSFFLEVLVKNHDLIWQASRPGHAIQYMDLLPTPGSFFLNLPLALFSGLFRPLPWEGTSWLHFLVGLENFVLLLVVFLGSYMVLSKKMVIKEKLLVFTALLFIMILALLLAMSSPNFGTLMRYKAAYLPFLLYLSLAGCQPLRRSLQGILSHSQKKAGTPENIPVTGQPG